MKLVVKRHVPLYMGFWTRSWSWWYVAYGGYQPFKRFDHGGWICLRLGWLRRFWNGANPCGAPLRNTNRTAV